MRWAEHAIAEGRGREEASSTEKTNNTYCRGHSQQSRQFDGVDGVEALLHHIIPLSPFVFNATVYVCSVPFPKRTRFLFLVPSCCGSAASFAI
uniref:Uncharacterized protein n=1 Tax=Caenorhabditis tropicalis TaxID=1561998 RepID=A0A1I7UMY7_9PELO